MSAKKQKREIPGMPPEYVKGPGKPGHLHPHWRKSFPDDEEDADGRGKVVFLVPESLRWHGEWRRVPGFYKILASADGFIITEGEWVVRKASVGNTHYLSVACNGTTEKVHLLVARAFHGRPSPDQTSVDHICGKDLPIEERRANNCAANLKWATYAEQNANQGDRNANSNGEPCLVWQVVGGKRQGRNGTCDTTRVEDTMTWFPSKAAAAKALGLNHGNLSELLNGKRKTVLGTDNKRYTGEWDPDHTKLPEEEWKTYWRSEKLELCISNYGRIQWGYPGRWGHMHYPESSDPKGYLRVKIDRKTKLVHVLVGELFWIGPKPRNWACYDHKDRDKQNNHIGNLRPVTVEENNLNTARQRDFYIWPEDDPDDWVRCVSQSATARAYNLYMTSLNAVLNKRPGTRGSIPKTVGGYCAAFCDEVE